MCIDARQDFTVSPFMPRDKRQGPNLGYLLINRRTFVQGFLGAAFISTLTEARAHSTRVTMLDRVAALKSLGSLSREQIEQAATDITHEDLKLVASLAAQLTNPASTNEVKCYAAYLLGGLNYRDSVPPLLANINLKSTKISTDFAIPLWFDFPAVEALSRLGSFGVAGVLELLKTTNDADVRARSLEVLKSTLKYPGVAEVILRDALAVETDANAIHHLHLAIAANKI